MTVVYRQAGLADLEVLTGFNAGLQRDQGSPQPLAEAVLRQRLADWLSEGTYQGILAERDDQPLGYALYCLKDERIFLRHFYIAPAARRQGLGRAFYHHLQDDLWPAGWPVQLNVLASNARGQAFWRTLGFEAFSLTLQQSPPAPH
ncbi:GNAT family N-acetyltransferase [Pseudomonas oryzihabitans]|uniref:GNAT family N-acetyltransferase n=1 Tax=Pseudomonas oryzihabitans TaxID=47885 RepID=UPI00135E069D|nr:GNAT family N-acetyltransferase [Pseudomonas oryzihabitans]MXS17505.1 GNAT family N-acetyltransferase [Pseudomonas oryzihabitans]